LSEVVYREVRIKLQPWQRQVQRAVKKYRFIVIAAGRQSGKTHLCATLIITETIKTPRSVSWWVAPVYSQAEIAFRRCQQFLVDFGIPANINKTEKSIRFPNGSAIWFKSGDKEDSLRGETVNFLVIDEVGVLKRDAWQLSLRGTITATNAKVVFIGTPKGKNLFYELSLLGQDRGRPEWVYFNFPSNASKYFSAAEWEDVKKLPERVFRQEYQAQFLDDGGEVFRGIRECVRGDFAQPKNAKRYYMGVDLAKSHDYTVIIILDEGGHCVYFDRFNSIAWTVQKKRIIDTAKLFNASVLLDSTGLGDPILDDLIYHISVEGFKFSNTSKRQLIENLSIGIERGSVSFPEIPELINELSIFSFEQSSTGVIRYNAPDGLHDDCVIALALAYWKYNNSSGMIEAFTDIGGRQMVSDIWS